MNARSRAIGYALAAACLFGLSTPMAKWFGGGLAPQAMAGILYLGSGIGLGAVWIFRRDGSQLGRRDLPWLAAAILSGGVLMAGLKSTSAATAALLLNFEAVATALIAWFVARENVGARVACGFGLIFAGAVLLSFQPGRLGFSPPALLILGACVCWGIDNNVTRNITAGDPVQIAAIKGLVAGGVNLALAAAAGSRTTLAWPVLGLGVVGLLGYGISLVFFIRALRDLGTARTGAYFSSAPFLGAAAAVLLLHEPLTVRLVLAGGLIALGVWLHISERHEHWHVHEEMEHEHLHRHDEHHRHEHSPEDPPGEEHTHRHRHTVLAHSHPHDPDIHHRHDHGGT
jgi:drug/metabolite transporter (DMT)-like permease